MNLRRLAATAAITTIALTVGSLASANAGGGHDDMGEFTVGETINFTFDCPTDFNALTVELGDTVVTNININASADYLFGYPYDTTGLEPGDYDVLIDCDETSDEFTFTFTLVAADPCAPVESIVTPKGPGRAPHGAPIDCSDSGLPDAGSNTSTVLLFGSLAVVAGTGLLIARRRTLA